MIIYNVTIKVDATIAESWLAWLLEEHIPEVMQTGCFSGNKVVRLLEVDETEGPTYAIQYSADSKADYNRYIQVHAGRLQELSYLKWGNRFIAFRSVMQVVRDNASE
ncbi:MAG: DUF4286 family protein [Chitinophagaceae bacterium]|nr:MAG: DUF4286 family protein [Chitinophagaceae bacterium]